MTITKGSTKYHIVYGLHSNIPPCCIAMWSYDAVALERARHIVFTRRGFAKCNYIPCLGCIKTKKFNKIVHCMKHKIPCEFAPMDSKGKRLSPPMKIKLSKDSKEFLKKFIEVYGI